MENITNRLPFYLQFANLSANKNNMLPTSMESEGGNVLENKTAAWEFLVQHPLCNRLHLATVKKKLQQPLTTWLGNIHFSLVTTSCQTVYRPV